MAGNPTEYDEVTCVTAGELRAAGIAVPASVPDCGWVPRGALAIGGAPSSSFDPETHRITVTGLTAVFTVPFRWIAIDVTVEVPNG